MLTLLWKKFKTLLPPTFHSAYIRVGFACRFSSFAGFVSRRDSTNGYSTIACFLNSEVKSAETRADLMFWSLDVARVSLLKEYQYFCESLSPPKPV
jgi:hypothetical protein